MSAITSDLGGSRPTPDPRLKRGTELARLLLNPRLIAFYDVRALGYTGTVY